MNPWISIHAPHAGRDPESLELHVSISTFQSTRPMRGATHLDDLQPYKTVKISIHAPHAGRDAAGSPERESGLISIHAPHAGRDPAAPSDVPLVGISIHAPHAGRDLKFQLFN